MKLDLGIMAGAESKAWLMELTKQIDRLEKLAGNFQASKVEVTGNGNGNGKIDPVEVDAEDEDEDESEDEEDNDFTSAPEKKKAGRPKGSKNKTASFDEDDEEESDEETESEDEEESDAIDVSQMKKGKTKKITLDMVNDAAKKLAAKHGKKGRAHVLGILEKNFKTQSISEIDESDYSKALKLLAS